MLRYEKNSRKKLGIPGLKMSVPGRGKKRFKHSRYILFFHLGMK